MRVLICGSRHFNDLELMESVIKEVLPYEKKKILIHGDAAGADRLSELVMHRLYHEWDFEVERYPADWEKHGKAAGPIRNYQMLKEGKPDMVVAFLAPNSRGTKHMIEIAQKAGIPVKIINIGN